MSGRHLEAFGKDHQGVLECRLINITDKQQIRKIAQYTDQQAAKGNFITFVLVTSPVPDDAFDIFWDSYTNLVYNISYISGSSVDFDHCSVIRFVTEPW